MSFMLQGLRFARHMPGARVISNEPIISHNDLVRGKWDLNPLFLTMTWSGRPRTTRRFAPRVRGKWDLNPLFLTMIWSGRPRTTRRFAPRVRGKWDLNPLFLTMIWSGRWDSNPRSPAWQADVLPLNYARSKSSSETLPVAKQILSF